MASLPFVENVINFGPRGLRLARPYPYRVYAEYGGRVFSTGRLEEKMKAKPRSSKESLLNRLGRIEGQVRGIVRMVEEDRYCIDVLTQVRAARAALAAVETEMLTNHLHHCVEGAIVSGDAAIQRKQARELIRLFAEQSR